MDYAPEDLLSVVIELTERYTGKESSSVTYEKAEQLMEAVLYCLHQHEQSSIWDENASLKNLDAAIDIKLAYTTGYEMVLNRTRKGKLLYECVMQEFDSYGNLAYYDTVVKGLPSFFVYYDPKFQPQNHILTLDYPVLGGLGTMCGIDVIWHYINCIAVETRLLQAFPKGYVVKLLNCVYDNYKELFINIPSAVVRNVLGWMMSGEKVKLEPLHEAALEAVKLRVNSMEYEELKAALEKCLKKFLEHGFQESGPLYLYFAQDIPDFAAELKNGAEHNCLVL